MSFTVLAESKDGGQHRWEGLTLAQANGIYDLIKAAINGTSKKKEIVDPKNPASKINIDCGHLFAVELKEV